MRIERLTPLALGLLLLAGCGAAYEAQVRAEHQAYLAYLSEQRPFGVASDCTGATPRVQRAELRSFPPDSTGVEVWLSTPTRADTERYVVTFPDSACAVVLESKVKLLSDDPSPFRPHFFREQNVLYHDDDIFLPPPRTDDYKQFLTSPELEVAIRERLLAGCAASGSRDCEGSADAWFAARSLSVEFSPADLPTWTTHVGYEADRVVLDLVDGRAYWNGEPL